MHTFSKILILSSYSSSASSSLYANLNVAVSQHHLVFVGRALHPTRAISTASSVQLQSDLLDLRSSASLHCLVICEPDSSMRANRLPLLCYPKGLPISDQQNLASQESKH